VLPSFHLPPLLISMPTPPDPLDTLLNQWEQRTPQTPSLKTEVWRRVALADEPVRRSLWERVHAVFARPSFAAAFIAACVLLGLFLAEVRRSEVQTQYNRELMQSYLRLIDPLLEAADSNTSTAETAAKS
jgi:hypothetical protein